MCARAVAGCTCRAGYNKLCPCAFQPHSCLRMARCTCTAQTPTCAGHACRVRTRPAASPAVQSCCCAPPGFRSHTACPTCAQVPGAVPQVHRVGGANHPVRLHPQRGRRMRRRQAGRAGVPRVLSSSERKGAGSYGTHHCFESQGVWRCCLCSH